MADQVSPPQPPIFNLNAYSPAEIKEAVEKVGVKKTNLPFLASLMLAVIAGGSIGLGALYYTIIVSDAELSFATARVMGGLAFSLGLAIVLVGGAELFTGNNLIVMAWASGKVKTRNLLLNWLVAFAGNCIGAVATAGLMFYTTQHTFGSGAVGLAALTTANSKVSLAFVPALFALVSLCDPDEHAPNPNTKRTIRPGITGLFLRGSFLNSPLFISILPSSAPTFERQLTRRVLNGRLIRRIF